MSPATTSFRRSVRLALLVLVLVCGSAKADSWRSADQMNAAAGAFLATLDTAQRDAVVFSLDAEERGRWSNLPILMMPPPGLMLGDLDDAQRRAVHDLLRASLSSQGYAKFTGVMRLDDLLHELADRRMAEMPESERPANARAWVDTYDAGHYAVALFGEPGSKNWAWKIAGHHAAANFTVADGRVAFTPTFLGSSPRVVQEGVYAGAMVLPQEGDRGLDLMRSLTPAQREQAIVAEEAAEGVFEGPGHRASLDSYEGLNADAFSPEQQRLLRALVEEYVRNADFDAADAQLQAIDDAGWGSLWFSWRGPVAADGVFYYRVHGPRLLIEYNRQNENHDHTIVRDPKNDYGDDWLGQHLREYHPTMEQIRQATQQRLQARAEAPADGQGDSKR